MITTISSINESNSKTNSIKQNKNNGLIAEINNSKQFMDRYTNSKQVNQITFTGDLTKLVNNITKEANLTLNEKKLLNNPVDYIPERTQK